MKAKLIIFPCNGNAIEALDCIEDTLYEVIGFVDDNPEKIGTTVFGIKVFSRSILEKDKTVKVLAVPGSPESYKKRGEIIYQLNIDRKRYVSIIHPKASVSKLASIGTNCLIMESVVVKATAVIEDNVCVLPNSIIHHDSKIGTNSLIGSLVVVAGNTKIGKNCYIGSKTSIKNGIIIGDYTLIGMGSNVVKDIASTNRIFFGNPAKEMLND